MNTALCLVAAWLATLPSVPPLGPSQAEERPLILSRGTRIRFATPEVGRALLTAEDDFSRNLSVYDLQCRLKTDQPVRLEDWRAMVADQVRPWSEREQRSLRSAIEELRQRLEVFTLPLPGEIWLVRTTGEEESNAAYTRGRAIVLPTKVISYAQRPLERLLAHELFHVMSRHDPALRGRLYRLIGFEPCDPIELPATLASRKITNPDAPLIDCVIRLPAEDGKVYTGAPVLYAADTRYDAQRKPTLFQSLIFRLLVVESRDGRFVPVLRDGQPVVIDPTREPAFFAQVGRNTDYLIHPDEILADNFVRLVFGDTQVATPQLLEKMRQILTAGGR